MFQSSVWLIFLLFITASYNLIYGMFFLTIHPCHPANICIFFVLHLYYRPNSTQDKSFFRFILFFRCKPLYKSNYRITRRWQVAVIGKEARGVYRNRQEYCHSGHLGGGRFKTCHRRPKGSPHCSGGSLWGNAAGTRLRGTKPLTQDQGRTAMICRKWTAEKRPTISHSRTDPREDEIIETRGKRKSPTY